MGLLSTNFVLFINRFAKISAENELQFVLAINILKRINKSGDDDCKKNFKKVVLGFNSLSQYIILIMKRF